MKSFHSKFLCLLLCALFSKKVISQAPIINAIQGPSVACASFSGTIDYSVTASNAPTSYAWSYSGPNTNLVLSNAGSSLVTLSFTFPYANAAYTLYCYASNSSGISNITSFVVNVFEMPTVTFSGASSFCQGSSTNLSASATLFQASSTTISYSWSPPTGLSSTNSATVFAYPLTSVTYTVLIANGPCTNTNYFNVVVNPLPLVNITANPTLICEGETSTITVTGNALSYSLGAITSSSLTSPVPTSTVVQVSPGESTTYLATGTSTDGCNSQNIAVSVIVNPIPTLSVVFAPPSICKGDTSELILGGQALSFSLNSVPAAFLTTLAPVFTTTYTVVGGLNGCLSAPQQVVLPVSPIPTVFVTSTRSVICAGEPETLMLSGIGNALTYSVNGSGNSATPVVMPPASTVFTITGRDVSGCTSSVTYPMTVNACLGIAEFKTVAAPEVYPNPNTGTFTIRSEKKEKVFIVNELGQYLRQLDLIPDSELEITALEPGVYFLLAGETRKKIVVTR